jgi:hypothetical protein
MLHLSRRTAALLACASFFLYVHTASAQAHFNGLELKRESASKVNFTFALNLPQVLHQVMAPELPYPSFLQSHADLPEFVLEKKIAKAMIDLSNKAYLTMPSGTKAHVKKWQLPDTQALRESFKASLLLLNMPPSSTSHLDPMLVRAQAEAKTPITRVQLQLPTALHPILVSLSNDTFWLTEHIPMAIVELP